ncbi:hydroxymyristoyl-ACP dehydratase [Aquimarina sp. TRL1]|uniref:3-hydroxyacyl-ACP dehydratase FabZ family protein n=1 Tax=Aquimarina sp. (strain TRL1) TaxID=2736252 RepID=UPI00158F5A5F|nr:hydroxymyristoyl-ACP dehydratase [Aquimarina sp. TRL1]QKX06768.1 hydroxymyristoyl-ACP dehydratase [Aquimarina sp. TRL1]
MTTLSILKELPYQKPFLFVDRIIHVNEQQITGTYTFLEDEYFYKGHQKKEPVTPGFILIECMSQIGLVSLGIYLFRNELRDEPLGVAITDTNIHFYTSVLPGEKVTVISDKEYFKFNILKCKMVMYDSKQNLIAKGTITAKLTP